jgi:hypothetical protein
MGMEELSELDERLEKLEAEEHEVSAQRAKLHDRLASFSNPETERHERELSERRRELHDEIDRLKAQRDSMGKASS